MKPASLQRAAAAAVALLLAAAAFRAVVLGPLREEVAGLEGTRWRAQHGLTFASRGPDTVVNDLDAFYAFFRRHEKPADWLVVMFGVAEQNGLRVAQGEYRRVESIDAPLIRYEVTLPLTGDYRHIRAFAEGTLSAVPIASLDHIALHRPGAAQREVEAALRFTLHLAPDR